MLRSLNSSPVRTGLIAYGFVTGAWIVYNVRWRYIGDIFLGSRPKTLPMITMEALPNKKKKHVVVVLLHGMWHDASWYSKLQHILKERGYSSFAIHLLPGERALPGFSQREIVSDLEQTLLGEAESGTVEYVMVGHSQGGLVAQSCLKNSPKLQARTKGVVLLGTFPLGMVPPIQALWKQPRNMYSHIGYLGICLTGRLISVDYLRRIFLLPTTDPATLPEYTAQLLEAPSDGLVTMSHFPEKVGVISRKPALVLGAADDIIYPPRLVKKGFEERFPNATHKIVPKQAHCFMDAVAWDTVMEDTLIEWLDSIV